MAAGSERGLELILGQEVGVGLAHGLEDLTHLENVVTLVAVDRGDSGVVVEREVVIAFPAVDDQAAVDVAVEADALEMLDGPRFGRIAVQREHRQGPHQEVVGLVRTLNGQQILAVAFVDGLRWTLVDDLDERLSLAGEPDRVAVGAELSVQLEACDEVVDSHLGRARQSLRQVEGYRVVRLIHEVTLEGLEQVVDSHEDEQRARQFLAQSEGPARRIGRQLEGLRARLADGVLEGLREAVGLEVDIERIVAILAVDDHNAVDLADVDLVVTRLLGEAPDAQLVDCDAGLAHGDLDPIGTGKQIPQPRVEPLEHSVRPGEDGQTVVVAAQQVLGQRGRDRNKLAADISQDLHPQGVRILAESRRPDVEVIESDLSLPDADVEGYRRLIDFDDLDGFRIDGPGLPTRVVVDEGRVDRTVDQGLHKRKWIGRIRIGERSHAALRRHADPIKDGAVLIRCRLRRGQGPRARGIDAGRVVVGRIAVVAQVDENPVLSLDHGLAVAHVEGVGRSVTGVDGGKACVRGVDEQPVSADAELQAQELEGTIDDALIRHVETAESGRGQRALALEDVVLRRGVRVTVIVDVQDIAFIVVHGTGVAAALDRERPSNVVEHPDLPAEGAHVDRVVAVVGRQRRGSSVCRQGAEVVVTRAEGDVQLLEAVIGDTPVEELVLGKGVIQVEDRDVERHAKPGQPVALQEAGIAHGIERVVDVQLVAVSHLAASVDDQQPLNIIDVTANIAAIDLSVAADMDDVVALVGFDQSLGPSDERRILGPESIFELLEQLGELFLRELEHTGIGDVRGGAHQDEVVTRARTDVELFDCGVGNAQGEIVGNVVAHPEAGYRAVGDESDVGIGVAGIVDVQLICAASPVEGKQGIYGVYVGLVDRDRESLGLGQAEIGGTTVVRPGTGLEVDLDRTGAEAAGESVAVGIADQRWRSTYQDHAESTTA